LESCESPCYNGRVIEFRILGPLEVARDGRPLPLTGHRQRALLAALLLRANQVVATDRLVDELWRGEPPKTATTALHNVVSQLRRLLGDDVLLTRPPGYLLCAAPEQIDAGRFEAALRDARGREPTERAPVLRDALAMWRGPALADVVDEPYAELEARRLEELRLVAIEERVEADLALGAPDDVVPELESLVAANPLRERPRAQLMLALYRAGRQADALRAYAAARRTLVEELGIEPGPALQRLHAEILRQERSLEPVAAAARPSDHFAEIARALLAARLVPVLGSDAIDSGRAGEVVCHRGAADHPPSDAEVAAALAAAFDQSAGGRSLPGVAQRVAVTQGVGPLYDELHHLLARDFAPGPAQRFLASLPPVLRRHGQPYQLIVTTSLDITLERAFADAGEPVEVVSYIASGRDRGKFLHVDADGRARVVTEPNTDAQIQLDRCTVIMRLHGRVDVDLARSRESFVVTEDDYIDYLAHAELASVVPVTLAAKLRRSHFLFLGYGVDEWNLRVFLRRVWGNDRVDYRSWAVHPRPSEIIREFWRLRGVDTYDVAIEEYADELRRHVEALAEAVEA
jgi:DNA-binding SARP family transcriptional activator